MKLNDLLRDCEAESDAAKAPFGRVGLLFKRFYGSTILRIKAKGKEFSTGQSKKLQGISTRMKRLRPGG